MEHMVRCDQRIPDSPYPFAELRDESRESDMETPAADTDIVGCIFKTFLL